MEITRPRWLNILPPTLSRIIEEQSRVIQVPHEMVVLPALSAISAACLAKYRVQILPAWSEPLCLFTATIALPGSRKTAVCDTTFKPLFDQDFKESDHALLQKSLIEEKIEALKGLLKDNRRELKKLNPRENPKMFEEAAGINQQIQDLEAEADHNSFLCQDATPEAMVKKMEANGGKIAILSDEGEFIQIVGGRYSDGKSQIEAILKAYYGSPIKQSRIGRGNTDIKSAQATIGIMIQPSVWNECMENNEFRSKGFLGRFLYSKPVNNIGMRLYEVREVDQKARDDWRDLIASVWSSPGCVMKFDEDASECFVHWCQFIEVSQYKGDYLFGISDWASKLGGTVARIAAMFAIIDNEATVSLANARRAIVLADGFLIPQALEVLGGENYDDLKSDTIVLMMLIAGGATKHRDVKKKRAFRKLEDFLTHAKILVEEELVNAEIVAVNGREYERFTPTDRGKFFAGIEAESSGASTQNSPVQCGITGTTALDLREQWCQMNQRWSLFQATKKKRCYDGVYLGFIGQKDPEQWCHEALAAKPSNGAGSRTKRQPVGPVGPLPRYIKELNSSSFNQNTHTYMYRDKKVAPLVPDPDWLTIEDQSGIDQIDSEDLAV